MTAVELTLDRPDCIAGEVLEGRVRVSDVDDRVRGGRVDLLYVNTFRYDVRDSDGDRVTRTRRAEVVVATTPLGPDGQVTDGERRLAMPLPPTAPGSAPDSVDWLLRAVVDRRLAGDAVAEAPLLVRVPAGPLLAWAQAPVLSPEQCAMDFALLHRVVRPGEHLRGTLALRAAEDLDARALRLQLRQVRVDPDENETEDVVAQVELCGELALRAGEDRAYPFLLSVPIDAAPSFAAANNTLHWLLEAVLDRPLGSDRVGRLEVLVHTA